MVLQADVLERWSLKNARFLMAETGNSNQIFRRKK